MKNFFLRWIIVIVTIVAITMIYFVIAEADDFQLQQKTQLKNEALVIWKHIQEQKKENYKSSLSLIIEEKEKEKSRQEERELKNLLRLKDALELTKDFVDSGGVQERDNLLVVGYDYYRGELAPVWADFSQELSKLKSFEALKRE